MNAKLMLKVVACLLCWAWANSIVLAQDSAKEAGRETSKANEATTCAVRGRVAMPNEVSDGINTEGLSLRKTIITLEGKYNHPRLPYPSEWSEMKPEDRSKWRNAFMNTDGYKEYLRSVEVARSKRTVYKTEIEEDGSFVFENVKPAWYQLSAVIMHSDAGDNRSLELARAYAMRQFFVRIGKPSSVNLTLKLKNVLRPGDLAPDWKVKTLDGGELKLSDFRGKFVLFDVWATWCGPCLAEFPHLKAVHEEFGGKRLELIGISVDETIDLPRAMLKKSPSPYRQCWVGGREQHEKISEAYGFETIPSIWLIGPDGRIIARDLLRDAIGEAVKAAFDSASKRNDRSSR